MRSTKRTFGFLATGLLLLLAFGCFSDTQRLSRIVSGDPKQDCEAAMAHGDLRFYAVNGFASGMVLGTDQHGADRDLIQSHGVRTIPGTSDYSSNWRFNQRASDYARIYNGTLLRHLRTNAPSSVTESDQPSRKQE
jgi:hypothetical protein